MLDYERMIDLKSAAISAGVHRTTIFRAMQQGKVQGHRVQFGSQKSQFFLEKDSFEKWLGERSDYAHTSPSEVHAQPFAHDPMYKEANAQPRAHSAHRDAQTVVQDQSVHTTLQQLSQALSEALRQSEDARLDCKQAWEESRRLERQLLAAQFEISKYQNALTERAESFSEISCAKLELEKKVETIQDDHQSKLAEENARQLQEFEQEKAALVERLKMSENRVDWLEKRVPRWVRSLFRAG